MEVKEMGFHGHDTAEEATQCKETNIQLLLLRHL